MCPLHLRFYFLAFVHLLKGKYNSLTLYLSGKVTFMSLKYVKASLMCVFSPRHTLERRGPMIGKLNLPSRETEENSHQVK